MKSSTMTSVWVCGSGTKSTISLQKSNNYYTMTANTGDVLVSPIGVFIQHLFLLTQKKDILGIDIRLTNVFQHLI